MSAEVSSVRQAGPDEKEEEASCDVLLLATAHSRSLFQINPACYNNDYNHLDDDENSR